MSELLTVQGVEILPNIPQAVNYSLYEEYIQYIDGMPRTVDTYKKALKQFFNYLTLNNITQPVRTDVIAFRDDLKASGHKAGTVQNYITAVKLFFRWTAQAGYYPNIADNLKGAKVDKSHKKDYLTSKQVQRVLGQVSPETEKGLRDYAILVSMITLGLRDIEVTRANIEDMRVLGDNTYLYVQGKGKEEKNDKIIIPPDTERAIRAYLAVRTDRTGTAPLFASTSNNNRGERMTTRSISGIAKKRLVAAGYDSPRLTAHSLRHTAVTLSLLAGEDLDTVRQFARHSNIQTTMIYNHSLDETKNTCSASIAKAIFG